VPLNAAREFAAQTPWRSGERAGTRAQDRRGRRGGQAAHSARIIGVGRSGAPFVVVAVHDEIHAQVRLAAAVSVCRQRHDAGSRVGRATPARKSPANRFWRAGAAKHTAKKGGKTPMKKEQVDLGNRTVFIADSKTPTGVAEVPLTDVAVEAFRSRIRVEQLRTGETRRCGCRR